MQTKPLPESSLNSGGGIIGGFGGKRSGVEQQHDGKPLMMSDFLAPPLFWAGL